jgi:hypothetical protein
VLLPGLGIEFVTQSVAGTITINNTEAGLAGGAIDAVLLSGDQFDGESGPGGTTAEDVRDIIGTALQGTNGVTVAIDDPGNADQPDARHRIYAGPGRRLIVGTSGVIETYNDAGNSEGLTVDPEFVRDTIGAALTSTSTVRPIVDDAGNTIGFELISEDVELLVTDPNGAAHRRRRQALFPRAEPLQWLEPDGRGAAVSTTSSAGIPTIQLRRMRAGVAPTCCRPSSRSTSATSTARTPPLRQ